MATKSIGQSWLQFEKFIAMPQCDALNALWYWLTFFIVHLLFVIICYLLATSSSQPAGQSWFECIQQLFVIYLSLFVICYHLLATSSNQPVDQNQFECSQQWQRFADCNLRSSPSNGIVNKMVIIIINHDYRHHRGHDPVYYDDYDSSHDNDDDLDSSTCVSQAQEAIADPEAPIAWV